MAISKAKSKAKIKNVLLIVADDYGYMDVGFNNPNSFYDTPCLDKLAKSGLVLKDAYAACPVCSPTRYSIQTGRYPTRGPATDFFGGKRAVKFLPAQYDPRMALSEVTIAEALKPYGYKSIFAGKWHLGDTETHWPEGQGYDVNKGGWTKGGPYGGKRYFSPYGNPRLEDGPDGEHLPKRLADEIIKSMTDWSKADTPFFANLSFYSVHTPLMGRKDLVAKYKKRAKQLHEGKEIKTFRKAGYTSKRRERIVQDHAIYGAMVEAMDEQIGRVLGALDTLGIADETLVIFFSDNGGLSTSEGSPTSNMPLRCGKGWMYEGGIREPGIIRAPGLTTPGSSSVAPVTSTDFYPTILDLLGKKLLPDQHKDGVSLRPILDGSYPKEFATRPIFWHYPHYGNQGGFPSSAIRKGDWKLIQSLEDGHFELYNLKTDIGEQKNLAKTNKAKLAELFEHMKQIRKDTKARFLRPKPGQKEKPYTQKY
ncbi:MAG: sulfatase [Phycisphaerales bacterium]|nr:sulfatase [Phycisphaerales bacterium]